MSPTLASALAIVRGWTRVYTAHLDRVVRDARRAEIESDLWEFHEDARRRGYPPGLIAAHMLLRLVLGVPHDLSWRAEHARVPSRLVQETLWATAVGSIAFVWWLASALQALDPPRHIQAGGINVMRVLYPLRPLDAIPAAPPPPRAFVRLTSPRFPLRPPPPPPPPECPSK